MYSLNSLKCRLPVFLSTTTGHFARPRLNFTFKSTESSLRSLNKGFDSVCTFLHVFMWPVFCLHPHPSVSSRPPLETTVEILPLKKKASDVSENHKHSHKSTHTVWNVISVGKLSLSTTILVGKKNNKKKVLHNQACSPIKNTYFFHLHTSHILFTTTEN